MPVQTPHAEYLYRKADWCKIRHFVEGARAVRAQGVGYLPKPSGWKDAEYDAYKQRAEVYGAVDRTIDGLDGAIFRKAPQVETPDSAEELTQDITLAGETLNVWMRSLVREVLTVGRQGVLVEFTTGSTAPDERVRITGPQRPYVVSYSAEQIINWECEVIDGVTKLTLVVLEETVLLPSPNDPFVKVSQKRYRVLRLADGKYIVELWTPDPTQKPDQSGISSTAATKEVTYIKAAEMTPVRRGTPLDRIPFFFISPSGQDVSPQKPPLLDITDLCILHYITSADYAHGLHWVGLPTPYVCGAREKENLSIGPSAAIVLEDAQAKVGMLEFTGQGLTAVKERLEGLERKMAALGARILEEQKKDAESGDALKLRQGGDASVLAGISDAVSRSVEAVVKRLLWWAEGAGTEEPDVTISLNMDFFSMPMDPQLLTALMQAWQSGGISKDTFLWNLKRGEMLPEDTTIEDEKAKTEAEPPPGLPNAAPTGGGKGGAQK